MTLKVLKIQNYEWTQTMLDIVKNSFAKLSTLNEFKPVIGKPGLYRDTSCITPNWIEILVDGELKAFEVHEYQFLSRLDILNAIEKQQNLAKDVRNIEVKQKLAYLLLQGTLTGYVDRFSLPFILEPSPEHLEVMINEQNKV